MAKMTSQVVSVSGGLDTPLKPTSFVGAGMPSHATTTANAQVDTRPKVSAPKPVEIKYDAALNTQNLKAAVNLLNEQLASNNRGLGFSFDASKNTAVVKVTDLNTGEVVRQIPSEDVLRIARNIDEAKGILFN
jgi:flagellar protein FlaG